MFGSALRAAWEDDVPRLGASLAYYTLFAIAPVLLVATAIAGLAFGPQAVRGEIVGQIDYLVGRDGARAVQSLLEGASQRRAGYLATIVGSVTLVLAATGAFLELQTALNTIWRVKPNPTNATFTAFVMDRVRSFGLVVALGFLLLVSLAVSAALAALGTWLERISPGMPLVWNAMNVLVSLVVITALCCWMFETAVQQCRCARCGETFEVPVDRIEPNSRPVRLTAPFWTRQDPLLRTAPAAAASLDAVCRCA